MFKFDGHDVGDVTSVVVEVRTPLYVVASAYLSLTPKFGGRHSPLGHSLEV